ncbi:hypothetical protein C8Q77DRAFT_1095414 [Trametes polyzona]|nr:hypothetical protein C8Q77DRAFT_1095414 [Trametes polyzona]
MAHSTFVDSANTELIKYLEPSPAPSSGPAWSFDQSSPLFGAVYNSTLSRCNTSGASVVFSFHGSNVLAFGSVIDSNGGDPPASTYSVDGGPPTPFTAPQTTGRMDAVQFFASGPLPLTNHTLTINITKASSAAPYYLDYVQFSIDVLPLSSASDPGTTPVPSSTVTSVQIPLANTLSGTDSATPSPSSDGRETKPMAPTGAIVGGVVGGIAVICLIIAALHWRHTRRPPGEYNYGTRAHQDLPPSVIPFVASRSGHPTHSRHPPPRARYRNGGGVRGAERESDSSSEETSSGGVTPAPSEAHAAAAAPVRPEAAHPPERRYTEMSYMRPPPSTAPDGQSYHGMRTFSDLGEGDSEVLPAYTSGPPAP